MLSNRITELEQEIAELDGNKFKKFVDLKHEKKCLENELSSLKGNVNLVDKLGGSLRKRGINSSQPLLKSAHERKPVDGSSSLSRGNSFKNNDINNNTNNNNNNNNV
mmetsp:Transcript_49666/g.63654  ORF Transcript_49666/g.63654 Transcript_49666/m.63654 type:complete len:107 (+) Transcript_49666:987-1307(+)